VTHLVSSLLHFGGAVAVLLAAPGLLRRLAGGWEIRAAGWCHVVCVTALLLASSGYHAARQLLGASPVTEVLVRVDHGAVWLILAGFFVLPHLIALRGAWRWAPLAAVWAAASLGALSKALWFVDQTPAEIVVPYALASLVGVASTGKFVAQRGVRRAGWLLAFWAAFTAAACCFVFHAPNLVPGWVGYHEVWHAGVLAGIYCHWRFVLELAPEAADAFPRRPWRPELALEGEG